MMDSKLFGDLHITSEVVERQLERWNALQKADRENQRKTPAAAFRFVTIARDEGGLGTEVAQELSKRLGWHLFDREIVSYIARESHVRENLVRQLEGTTQSAAEDVISRFLKMFESKFIENLEYHLSLVKTLAYLAKSGSSIIVGRGANFVLRDDKEGVNARITASPEIRIQRVSQSMKITLEEARRHVQTDDEERRRFMHKYYRRDYENVEFYDAVYNTDRASAKQVASSIIGLIKHPAETGD
jgi:cytidylate kinase